MAARTLFDKIWDTHVVSDLGSGIETVSNMVAIPPE